MDNNIDVTNEELMAILATDQVAFTQQVFHTVDPAHKYLHNWHIECTIEHLQALQNGDIRRLIVNMPPRSLKSIMISVAWPAWLLGQNASEQIITASYANDLAIKHSVDTRLVLESEWYKACFPETVIARDQNEKKKFQTTKRGHRKATSVGGSITGEGADYLIGDDLIKPDEAGSDVIRDGTNNWVDQTFLTRENDYNTSRVLITMQRVHQKDPAGHLMEKGGWQQLILPAYFDERTIIQVNKKKWICEQDTFLHEERMGDVVLDQKLTDLGMQAFVGQYLQRPSPDGGGEFKARNIHYYNQETRKFTAKGMNVYILYDPANTKKAVKSPDPDYTAIVVVGLASDNNYYLLDIIRDRFNQTERVDALFNMHMKWSKLSGRPAKVGVEQYGMMTDKFQIDEKMKELNYRFFCIEMKGRMAKNDRIRGLTGIFEADRVYFPEKIMYTDLNGETHNLSESFVKEELLVFPVGRHDDIIDAFARIKDPDLGAVFPKIGVVYLEGGQTLKDSWREDFAEDDFMTW